MCSACIGLLDNEGVAYPYPEFVDALGIDEFDLMYLPDHGREEE